MQREGCFLFAQDPNTEGRQSTQLVSSLREFDSAQQLPQSEADQGSVQMKLESEPSALHATIHTIDET